MIGRIRTRQAFERLRRDGRRVRSDTLWCTFVVDDELSFPHVAFAIGRPVGPAVVRNRLRRRLRALLAASSLPSGWFLVGARPGAAALSFRQLDAEVRRLERVIRRRSGIEPCDDV